MTPHEERRITQWSKEVANPVRLTLNVTPDERSDELRAFCNDLSAFASNIEIIERLADKNELPSIQIGDNIRYSAIPAGPELEPFLQAIALCGDNSALLPRAIQAKIENINAPALLRLYIAQQCPHCPTSVRQLVSLAFACKFIGLEIIDSALFPEMAQANAVQCVPTILLNDDFRWSGLTPLGEIAEVLCMQDPSSLSGSAIERMLEEGNAAKVAHMILERGKIFPAFLDLITDDKFITRLGAMTVMEEVTKQNIELAAEVIGPLWKRFEQVIEPIQIDILYLLGDTGTSEIIPLLQSVINGYHRDHVKEAASEAIESIKSRDCLN